MPRTSHKPSMAILTTLLIISFLPSLASPSSSPLTISKGSSFSVSDDTTILISPDETFTFGFYNVGENAYTLSIWFTNTTTLAWTANRDLPVNIRKSKLTFRTDGGLALTDADGTVVWSTNTTGSPADRARLKNTGNLIVGDSSNILWQSFDSPTETLLPSQPINRHTKLVSAAGVTAVSSGYYSLYFDSSNVLILSYDGPETSSIYWPNPDFDVWTNGRTTYNSSRYGLLDELGQFTASDGTAFNSSDMGDVTIKRRLTVDYDGNLRLYSLQPPSCQDTICENSRHQNGSSSRWTVSWEALLHLCQVHGLCGRNGICSYTQSRPVCSCPHYYKMSDPSDWSKGCQREPEINIHDPRQVRFIQLQHTDFWGYDLNTPASMSVKECKNLCRRDSSCEAVAYRMGWGMCYAKSVLFNGRSMSDTLTDVYLKVPKGSKLNSDTETSDLICNANTSENQGKIGAAAAYGPSGGGTKWIYFYSFLLAFGVIEILFIGSGWWFIFRRGREPTALEKGYRAISSQFRKFTYAELKRATGKFRDELGRGVEGAVYKGKLDDERVVAVKKLENAIQGEEFWAEVTVIGRIYHMNLVRMWGFCSEEAHKLLVYEYVENGSLDKHLFTTDGILGWSRRFKIAVGVAKGLAYLHHECLEWIIHCDVKPENILLDGDFEPKISDFGLVKLSKRGGSGPNLKRIRGTRGYMAPEWGLNHPITAMVDVYSYGIVLLELVKGSRVSDWMVGEEEEDAELMWSVRMLKQRLASGEGSWLGDFVDPRLNMEFSGTQVAGLLRIAISCLEEERSRRPTMDSIVQNLMSYKFGIP